MVCDMIRMWEKRFSLGKQPNLSIKSSLTPTEQLKEEEKRGSLSQGFPEPSEVETEDGASKLGKNSSQSSLSIPAWPLLCLHVPRAKVQATHSYLEVAVALHIFFFLRRPICQEQKIEHISCHSLLV